MRIRMSLLAATAALGACVPTALKLTSVVPLPANEYQVTANWKEKDLATRWALEAAEITCARRNMRPVVVNQLYALKGVVVDWNVPASAVQGKGQPASPLYGRHDWTTQLLVRCER